MSAEIIASIAWECDNKDCPHAWHMGSYWANNDESYSYDSHTDGDHAEVEQKDIPTSDAIQGSWRKYAQWVWKNNEDPLHNFPIQRTRHTKVHWTIDARLGMGGGWMVTGGSHRGKTYTPHALPPVVREYFELEQRGRQYYLPLAMGSGIGAIKDYCKEDSNAQVWTGRDSQKTLHIMTLVPVEVPYAQGRLAKELRKVARRAMRSEARGV